MARFEHLAAVALEDIAVLVPAPHFLPVEAHAWPVRFIQPDAAARSGAKHIVLCGTLSAVEDWLARVPAPLYVITDSPQPTVYGRLNICISSLAASEPDVDWESVVAAVCSRHVRGVARLILDHARRTPDAEAACDSTGSVTYAELCSMAAAVGDALAARVPACSRASRAAGRAGDQFVGVQLAPSICSCATLLGLNLRRFTPCDIADQPTKRQYMLEHAGCVALLAESDVEGVGDGGVLHGVPLMRIDHLVLPRSTPLAHIELPPAASLGDAHIVGWTSGSTGTPKGMAVTSYRIAHWSRWRTFHMPVDAFGTRAAMNLFWIWYWHIPLTMGRTLVITPSACNVDVVALMRFLQDTRATYIDCLTPSQLQLVVELCDVLPPTLVHVFSSGEALPLATARAFLRKFTSVRLHNLLATTETSADICVLKDVTLPMVEALLTAGHTHAPIVGGSTGLRGIVWNNSLTLEPHTGRMVISGWNVEPGYMIGGDPTAFASLNGAGSHDGRIARYAFTSNDRAVWDGDLLMIVGRTDAVVKVRGHRVDLSGAEAQLLECEHIIEGVVLAHDDALWALVVSVDLDAVRAFVERTFEESTRPVVVPAEAIPKTATGKQDRNALSASMNERLATWRAAARTEASSHGGADSDPLGRADDSTTRLDLEPVHHAVESAVGFRLADNDNLFANGCTSLKAMRLAVALKIPIAAIFAHPTPAGIAGLIAARKEPPAPAADHLTNPSIAISGDVDALIPTRSTPISMAVSIAGMGVRLPGGVDSLGKLWRQLYAAADLTEDLPSDLGDGYIKRKGVVSVEGLPTEDTLSLLQMPIEVARRMGPEQRVALEVAVAALRDAGFDPAAPPARTGIFVTSSSLYHPTADLNTMRTEHPDTYFAEEVAHDKDFVASTLAYHLNLTGPAEVIQTSCSSSLVALIRGVHAIRLGLCETAICGGVSLSADAPVRKLEGMIWSPDGVCRPFSDDASGTVTADGAALVVITARPCPRQCYASIKGVAVNNDGKRKSAFSQPSHQGQAEVLRAALSDGNIAAADVDYIECHGTGTRVGDPIELHALAEVHAGRPSARRPLLVGSIKGNVGHMNTVAGVGSLVKAALCTYHGEVPPSPHSAKPNKLVPWADMPLQLAQSAHADIATVGVSSFGIGGTNAHVVLTLPLQDYPPPSNGTAVVDPPSTPHETRSVAPTFPKRSIVPGVSKSSTILSDDAACALLYEAVYERVEVAPAYVPMLPVVILDAEHGDGSALLLASLELTARYHIVSLAAAPAAAAAHGALAVVGGACGDDGMDELAFLVLRLLVDVGHAANSCDLFAFLADVPRYAGCRALLRTCRKELHTLSVRDLTVVSGPAPLPALPIDGRIDAGKVYEKQLRRLPAAALAAPLTPRVGARSAPVHVALVTGGLRGVGLRVGKMLLDEQRASRVVLVGRSAPRASDACLIEALVARGAEVRLCDVGDWAMVETLPDAELVVHCAGAIDDQLMQHVTAGRCAAVLRPKVRGINLLRRRYGKRARVVAFSSSSSLFGVAGQATYAAANAYLDELLGGEAVQWGGWGEVGMAVDFSIEPTKGERFVALSTGLQLLGKIMDGPPRSRPAAAIDADWKQYSTNLSIFGADEAPLYSSLVAQEDGGLLAESTPLVGLHMACGVAHTFTLTLGGTSGPWQLLRQHVVGRTAVVPASAYLAWVVAALQELRHGDMETLRFEDCRFVRMLDLAEPRTCTLTLSSSADGANAAERGVAVISRDGVVHATMAYHVDATRELGRAASSAHLTEEKPDRDGVEPRRVARPYEAMLAQGYSYGPAFAQMTQLSVYGPHASAQLVAETSMALNARGTVACCPAALDAALQLASFLEAYSGTGTPVAIGTLEWRVGASLAETVAHEGADGAGAHVEMLDSAGKVVGIARGMQMAPAEPPLARLVLATTRTIAQTTGLPSDDTVGAAIVDVGVGSTTTAMGACRALRQQVSRSPVLVRAASEDACGLAAAVAHDVAAIATDMDGHPLSDILVDLEVSTAQVSSASAGEPYAARTDAHSGRVFFERFARPETLAPLEVEIHTTMWALNFRDVLVAKGVISSVVAGRSLGIGGECYGIVTRVGSDVRAVAAGDHVVALPPDGMGSFLVTDARWVFRADPTLDSASAVSGTMAYATAWLALHTQARMRAGDTVLIHSAAGGVGLAAVNLCLAAGCRVLATASTEAKRRMLLERGVAAVFNSRSVAEFTTGVRAATGEAGVDIVLNSLAGDALTASIDLLKPFGQLVELGKRDAYEGRELSLSPFLRGITFSAAHIDVLMLERPDTARALFDEVRTRMAALPALPVTTYTMDEVNEALQFMSSGTHIGKILIAASAVSASARLPFADCSCAPNDALARSVASALDAVSAHDASHGRCVVVADVPAGCDETRLDTILRGAEVLITRSRLLAWYATRHAGVPLAIEMRGPWGALAPSLVRQLMTLRGHGHGHVVARGASATASGADADAIPLLVSELVTSEVDPDTPLASYGLDSLMLITLASRLTARLGRRITAEEIETLGTMRALQDALRGDEGARAQTGKMSLSSGRRMANEPNGAQAVARRPQILCIHGYRSSAEVMELQMRPYVSAIGTDADFVFAQAHTRSTGPQDPTIPDEVPTFEWYGVVGGSYEEGWLREPQKDVLDTGLDAIAAQGAFDGVIGFSQGGAIASLVDARWGVFFSTITPPPERTCKWGRPTLHIFDKAEEYVQLCEEMAGQAATAAPEATQVVTHQAGHNVPQDAASVEAVVKFVRAQMKAVEESENGSGWVVV